MTRLNELAALGVGKFGLRNGQNRKDLPGAGGLRSEPTPFHNSPEPSCQRVWRMSGIFSRAADHFQNTNSQESGCSLILLVLPLLYSRRARSDKTANVTGGVMGKRWFCVSCISPVDLDTHGRCGTCGSDAVERIAQGAFLKVQPEQEQPPVRPFNLTSPFPRIR